MNLEGSPLDHIFIIILENKATDDQELDLRRASANARRQPATSYFALAIRASLTDRRQQRRDGA
jgi:hypothetical protein